MTEYYLAAMMAVLLTAVSQVVLKLGAIQAKSERNVIKAYFNRYSIVAYVLFLLVTLFSLLALKKVLVKEMVVFLPWTYLIVPILSKMFLREHITKGQVWGILMVILGIVVFSLGPFLQ